MKKITLLLTALLAFMALSCNAAAKTSLEMLFGN